ncbi:septum formation initiator family protein [Spiribacter pallidus]|jgi:cell division protein FtsB|uniref:Cell division protein FtsB n=1 Tax=Spiribacter pallidus TaxID=1987936 RepID=A0ABV3TDG9_9GAMM
MRLAVAGLLLVLLLLQARLWLGDGSIPEVIALREAVEQQAQENARLDERNRALAADVADLRDGLEGIEERARRDLGMIGEDERFYRVIDESRR